MMNSLLILAAGMSSRMKKESKNNHALNLSQKERLEANQRAKGLISIDGSGRPLLDYILFNAKKSGFKKIYIVTGNDNQLFKEFYGRNESGNYYKGLEINYAVQYIPENRKKPYGTADAVYQAMEQYPELKQSYFVVCNSDNLYSNTAFNLLMNSGDVSNALIAYDRAGLMFSQDRISRFAVLKFNNEGFLKDIIEKPSIDQIDNFRDVLGKQRVSMNIFKLNGKMFYKYAKDCPVNEERDEKELPTALLNMVNDYPNAILGIPLSEHVPDLTSKEDIPILKAHVKKINLVEDW